MAWTKNRTVRGVAIAGGVALVIVVMCATLWGRSSYASPANDTAKKKPAAEVTVSDDVPGSGVRMKTFHANRSYDGPSSNDTWKAVTLKVNEWLAKEKPAILDQQHTETSAHNGHYLTVRITYMQEDKPAEKK